MDILFLIIIAIPFIWITLGILSLIIFSKKKCPYCKSRIPNNAVICKFCRKEI